VDWFRSLVIAASQIFVPAGQPLKQGDLSQVLVSASVSAPDGGGKPAYLIPEDGNTVGHWNAVDLNGGTAKIGPSWNTVGIVPYNPSTSIRPSVGPFSTSSYYTQISGPFSFSTAPFTTVMIWYGADTGSEQVFGGTTNQESFLNSTGTGFYYGSNLYASGSINVAPVINVTFGGIDGSGMSWTQLNGGSAVSTAGAYVGAGSVGSIGIYADLIDFPATGVYIIEELASKDIPSSALFSSIYNQILANE
jgi:hypothetical protein